LAGTSAASGAGFIFRWLGHGSVSGRLPADHDRTGRLGRAGLRPAGLDGRSTAGYARDLGIDLLELRQQLFLALT
jgi:hypothetical protein